MHFYRTQDKLGEFSFCLFVCIAFWLFAPLVSTHDDGHAQCRLLRFLAAVTFGNATIGAHSEKLTSECYVRLLAEIARRLLTQTHGAAQVRVIRSQRPIKVYF